MTVVQSVVAREKLVCGDLAWWISRCVGAPWGEVCGVKDSASSIICTIAAEPARSFTTKVGGGTTNSPFTIADPIKVTVEMMRVSTELHLDRQSRQESVHCEPFIKIQNPNMGLAGTFMMVGGDTRIRRSLLLIQSNKW